jgi:hypothetical protein
VAGHVLCSGGVPVPEGRVGGQALPVVLVVTGAMCLPVVGSVFVMAVLAE